MKTLCVKWDKILCVIWLVSVGVFPLSSFGEDTLKMLIWEGYAPPEYVEQFQQLIHQKYGRPIRVEVDENISDVEEFYDAIRGQKVHIISPAHNLIKDSRFGYIRNNLLMPIDVKNIPNYQDILAPLQHAEYITDEQGQVYGVPFAHGPYGLAYNTAYFTTPPDSWKVLWDPQYQGRYTISSDYYEANIFITGLAEGLRGDELYAHDSLVQQNISAKLKQLAQHAHAFWTGVDTADDLQGLALATTWGFTFEALNARGEQWKMAEPQEGTTGWVDNFVMSQALEKDPFLKNVAEEWMNFILSPEYQAEVVVRQLHSDPVNLEVKDKLTAEEIAQHHLDNPNYFRESRWLWPVFKTKRERYFLRFLWDEALKGRQ